MVACQVPPPPPPTPHPTTTLPHPTTTVAHPTTTSGAPPSTTTTVVASGGPQLGGCPVLPADNAWNRDISSDPVDPQSGAYVASIGATGHLHPDFGSSPADGIPYVVVPGTQPEVPITFTAYGDESDPGPYPVPLDAPVEAGSDRHVLVADTASCKLYEMSNAQRTTNGWSADAGAVFDLRSDALRPDHWTSADAAGLPILPGLVRYDEVTAGHIDHALRFTVVSTQRAFIHPATHFASSSTDPTLPPMGLRLRMRADFDTSSLHGEALVITQAMKRYGLVVADNGSNWFVTGSTDTRWDDNDLDQLKAIPGSAFEVVQSGTLQH